MTHSLLGETFRKYSIYLSESYFLQSFCRLDRGSEIRIPGKSALQRYATWLPEEQMRAVLNELLGAASRPLEGGKQMLNLAEPLDLNSYFLDTTCVKLNIHFPNALSSSCAGGTAGNEEAEQGNRQTRRTAPGAVGEVLAGNGF